MNLYTLTEIESIQNYILGGRADFIINEKETDKHINFQIRKHPTNESIYFIKFKSMDWVYIGFIKIKKIVLENITYNVPIFYPFYKDKKFSEKEHILKADIFSNLIKYLYYIEKLPNNLEFLYTGICSVCGRRLTDPNYIKIGIGPVCLENRS